MSETTLLGSKVKGYKTEDNKVVYDLNEVQGAIDKLKKDKVINLPDLILMLFNAQKEKPIMGMILLMKEIFLLQNEFAPEEGIKVQDAEFINYKYGPYSIDVDKVIDLMEDHGLIISSGRKSTNKEIFYLTSRGAERAEKISGKLSHSQREKLSELRKGWDQLGVKGILRLVYRKYPNYIDKSEIVKKVLREKDVNRIRG
jgi:hypothetical protein